MDQTNIVKAKPYGSQRLSWSQRRDVVSMCAAAVVTSAITAAPFFAHPTPSEAPPPLAARQIAFLEPAPIAAPVSMPRLVTSPNVRRMRLAPRPATHAAALAVHPSALDIHAVALEIRPVALDAAIDVESPAPAVSARRSLSQKLAGFLVGNGTHAVHPFPTVPAQRQ
jgi:hypothetical protein